MIVFEVSDEWRVFHGKIATASRAGASGPDVIDPPVTRRRARESAAPRRPCSMYVMWGITR